MIYASGEGSFGSDVGNLIGDFLYFTNFAYWRVSLYTFRIYEYPDTGSYHRDAIEHTKSDPVSTKKVSYMLIWKSKILSNYSEKCITYKK